MEEKNENIPVNPKIKIKVSSKFENFWYYYKWHTIIGIAVVFVLAVITVQLFTRKSYDVNIVYAGEKSIGTTSLSGDGYSELSLLKNAIESASDDYDGDGEVNFNLQTLMIMSQNEFDELTKVYTDASQKAHLETEIYNNKKTLGEYMINGYFLYFLSEDVFREYDEDERGSMFVPLSGFVKSSGTYEYASERGIYISSLALYESSDLSMLPPDTVICLRIPGAFDGGGDGSYEAAERLLSDILTFGE